MLITQSWGPDHGDVVGCLQHGFGLGLKLEFNNLELDQTGAGKKEAWFGRKYLLNLQEAPTTKQLFQEPPLLDYQQLNPAQLIES